MKFRTIWWDRRGHWAWLLTSAALGAVCTLVISLLVADDGLPALEKGPLVILSGLDQSPGGQRQVLINRWNQLHPDNPATIMELPADADAQHAEMVARAQSGDSDVDIYNLDVTRTAEFAQAEFIRALDTDRLDLTGFLRAPLDTCRYDERLWALPFNTDVGLIYYRTDLLDRRPESWRDIDVDIERVLGGGPVGGVTAGYAGQFAAYEGQTVNILEALQSVVRGPVVRDGRLDVEPTELEEAVKRLRPTAGRTQLVLPESLDHREADTTRAFRDGRVLYMRNWPIAYREIKATPDGESAAQAVPFDVAALPGPGVLGGQNLAIASTSDRPRAAQALIEFLTSHYSEQILFERGGLAATRAIIYEDEDVRQEHPYADTLRSALDDALPRPVTPCYAAFSKMLRTAVDTAVRENEAVAAGTIEKLNQLLADCPAGTSG